MARFRVLLILFLIGLTGWCIFRDIQHEKQLTCDLQNRVIGARLQKEGKSPYFYKWKHGDGPRYYDIASFDSLAVSNITASPFFHDLLIPVADLPQRTISKIWLLTEYFMLLICIVVGYKLSANATQRWLVLIVAAIFMLTDAWTMHIAFGQMYITIPMLALLFYYFFNKTSAAAASIAGLCAISMVLIKPTTLVFLLPFSILLIRRPPRYRIFFFVPVLVLTGWTILSAQQRNLWLDYKKQVAGHIAFYQQLQPQKQVNDPDPNYTTWEGWDRRKIAAAYDKFHVPYYSEHGNVYIVYNHILSKNISLPLLTGLAIGSLVIMIAVFFIFYKKKNQLPPPATQIALLGFCLLMLADFFSPVKRPQYNTVQWLFLLLLTAAAFNQRLKWPSVFICLGLFLNIVHLSFIKMEHTIGEYLMLAGFLWLAFTWSYRDKPPMPSPKHP